MTLTLVTLGSGAAESMFHYLVNRWRLTEFRTNILRIV